MTLSMVIYTDGSATGQTLMGGAVEVIIEGEPEDPHENTHHRKEGGTVFELLRGGGGGHEGSCDVHIREL